MAQDPDRPSDPAAPKAVVREGWDRASQLYRSDGSTSDVFGHAFRDHRRWLQPILRGLPPGAKALDLGCGCGIPDCALLVDRFEVTGVDLSDVQIERARKLVPKARFVRADMTDLEFPKATLGAIVCLYALIHVPLGEQRALLQRARDWLVPRGYFLVVTGHSAYEGVEGDWLGSGAPMFWSHADADQYSRWFREIGFEIESQEMIPEGESGHELFLLRAP